MTARGDEEDTEGGVDHEHMMEVAQQAGFGERFLSTLSPEQMTSLVADLAGRMLGGGDGAPSSAAPVPPDDTTDPANVTDTGDMAMPPRDQMVSDLSQQGEDPQALDAMDDQALFELWKQLKGGGTPAPSPVGGSTFGERGRRNSGGRPHVVQLSPRTVRQYAEAAAKSAVAKATSSTRAERISKFCEDMVVQGFLTPAQVDPQTGPTRKLLEAASPVSRFGEGKSPLDMLMDEIRSRPPVRRFGELLPAGPGGVVGSGESDTLHEDVKDYLKRKYGKRA